MILAAGFGTRLAPLTGSLPKALIPVAGRPMIDHAILKLKAAGCQLVVVNCYHYADAMLGYFAQMDFGVEVVVIREESILGTGGGILNAASFLYGDEPFIVHNADIISDFPLEKLLRQNRQGNDFATLALHRGATSRGVLFDDEMNFLGKENWANEVWTFPERAQRFGFCGIHVLHPEIFHVGFSPGFSDIFDVYKSALLQKKRITGIVFDEYWTDLGTVEKIRTCEYHINPAYRAESR